MKNNNDAGKPDYRNPYRQKRTFLPKKSIVKIMVIHDKISYAYLRRESVMNELEVKSPKSYQELEIIIKALENHSSEINEKLRFISHDLANPLQMLGMCLEAVEDQCPPELLKLITRMKNSTASINQILLSMRELQAANALKMDLKR